eukprot:GDKI01026324.1.p1 GENE.GDKI01026324.1~~GDKI01026324.1.p1  ORF type:complete len:327 (+),score=80.09 GDKI01026324.1:109-1089(+)
MIASLQARLELHKKDHIPQCIHAARAAAEGAGGAVLYSQLLQVGRGMGEMEWLPKIVKDNMTLQSAAITGSNVAARILLEAGADINSKQQGEWVTMYYGAHFVTMRVAHQSTPLHCAAHQGHTHTARMLLNRGADINARNQLQETPLHIASRYGHTDTVRLLLERGADVHAKDQNQDTPLRVALSRNRQQITHMLRGWGAGENTNQQEATGIAPANAPTEPAAETQIHTNTHTPVACGAPSLPSESEAHVPVVPDTPLGLPAKVAVGEHDTAVHPPTAASSSPPPALSMSMIEIHTPTHSTSEVNQHAPLLEGRESSGKKGVCVVQ